MRLLAATGILAAVALGLWSAVADVRGYAANRGFGPPVETVAPALRGRLVTVPVTSPSLGGRTMDVLVYLPAAYDAHPTMRFPLIELLHGTPGDPRTAFVQSLHVVPRLDALIASGRMRPAIVAMPPGATSTYAASTEWADGPRPGEAWFTYATRDVPQALDVALRAIPSGAARGIAGFSSGADAAMNAVLLDPHGFHAASAWSGDFHQTPSTVGGDPALVRRFSAIDTAGAAARKVAAAGGRVDLYAGTADRVLPATRAVADALRTGGVPVRLRVFPAGHSWRLWAAQLEPSLIWLSSVLEAPR